VRRHDAEQTAGTESAEQRPDTWSGAVEPTDEHALVCAAREGDGLSFRALYELHGPSALRLAGRIVRNATVAEEVCQDAFCQAWTRLRTFEGRSRFRTWLLTIVRNSALDLLRRERVRRRVPLSDPHELEAPGNEPDEALATDELRGALDRALRELPEETRTAFLLAVLERIPYQEVAATLGTTTDGIKCRVYRAREHLRRRLKPFVTPA
jgi:RNA polymerase sigma-70 factor (ECF subfamily)